MKLIQEEPTLATAAAKAGMDEKTARKYRDLEKLPSQTKRQRTWSAINRRTVGETITGEQGDRVRVGEVGDDSILPGRPGRTRLRFCR